MTVARVVMVAVGDGAVAVAMPRRGDARVAPAVGVPALPFSARRTTAAEERRTSEGNGG